MKNPKIFKIGNGKVTVTSGVNKATNNPYLGLGKLKPRQAIGSDVPRTELENMTTVLEFKNLAGLRVVQDQLKRVERMLLQKEQNEITQSLKLRPYQQIQRATFTQWVGRTIRPIGWMSFSGENFGRMIPVYKLSDLPTGMKFRFCDLNKRYLRGVCTILNAGASTELVTIED